MIKVLRILIGMIRVMTSNQQKGEKYSAKLPSFNNLEVHRKQKQTIFM